MANVILLYSKIQEANHNLLLETYLSIFPKIFQEKIVRYHRWQDAQLSLLGRLLVKEGLNHFNQKVNFEELLFTEYNKPYFKNATVQFNISHSDEFVVAVFTEKYDDIGVDVEKEHSFKMSDFKNQMTPYEIDKIYNSDRPLQEFYKYWTQKEAVLKAIGSGLSIPLKSFEIKNNKTSIEGKTFYLSEIAFENEYICHIAQNQKVDSKEIIVKKVCAKTFIEN
ncbi:4'-phosphopantetheinyl transferase superfamily protein [uncultured Kordia sp.]|uniref:4'-phosphopantetheinyl transferase family protein n=1 Tax=uncultured Kordia sp. TaxID=507699 RepID=UPI002613C98C|nr:4'-phosphopantetheinyl transferase superfamily protein [uncultured Kordia sp.]